MGPKPFSLYIYIHVDRVTKASFFNILILKKQKKRQVALVKTNALTDEQKKMWSVAITVEMVSSETVGLMTRPLLLYGHFSGGVGNVEYIHL